MSSLLEKAQLVARHKGGSTTKYSREDIELSIAYLKGIVNGKQVKIVKDFSIKSGNIYHYIARSIQYGLAKNLIEIHLKEE